MKWWRVIVKRGLDYEYGSVACYEQQADAEEAKNTLMANRTDDIRRYGIEFIIRQDGDQQALPLNQHRTMQWVERLVPPDRRSMRRGGR